jgi:hypothetical protein
MQAIINEISAFSILAPAWMLLWRWKKILPEYYPFAMCILLALMNELVGSPLIDLRGAALNFIGNLYVLGEGTLLLWQFQRWQLFKNIPWLFPGLVGIIVLAWVIDTLVVGPPGKVSSYYRISSYFILAMCSISYINRLLLSPHDDLYRHAPFVLSFSFVLYFLYKILVEAFWVYGGISSESFQVNVYVIADVINIFTNLIFAYAFLWMNKKQPFTMPF